MQGNFSVDKEFEARIIDFLLAMGLILGVVMEIIFLFSTDFSLQRNLIAFISIFLIGLAVAYRKKIGPTIKVYVLLLIIYALMVSTTVVSGADNSNSTFIILIPIISYLVFSRKITLIFFVFSLASYLSIGFYNIYFLPDHRFQLYEYINHALILLIVGLTIQYFMFRYIKYVQDLFKDLNYKNDQLRDQREKFQETKQLLEKAIAHSPSGIMIADASSDKLTIVNKAALFIHGDEDELLNDINPAHYIEKWQVKRPSGTQYESDQLPLYRALRQGEIVKTEVLNIVDQHDQRHYVTVNAAPIKNENGDIISAIATIQDITSIKNIERSLIKERDFNSKILALIPAVFILYRLNNNSGFVFCNKKLKESLGYENNELDNKQMADIVVKKDRALLKSSLSKLNDGFPDIQLELGLLSKEGETKEHFLAMSTIRDEKDTFLVVFAINIVERVRDREKLKEYQEHLENIVQDRTEELKQVNTQLQQQTKSLTESYLELEKAQKKLIRAEKLASMGTLTAGIGHEINNPLNFIRGGAMGIKRMAEGESTLNKKELEELLNVIEEGVNRAAGIVKSLSHLTSSNTALNEICDIHYILTNSIKILSASFDSQIKIIENYRGKPIFVLGNDGKLHQIFMNIIANAAHAVQEDGKIVIETSCQGEECQVKITDNGKGISEEDLTKVADPFFTTKPPGEGSGLGMYIVHLLLEEHNGSWNIESRQSRGTTVTLTFPLLNEN